MSTLAGRELEIANTVRTLWETRQPTSSGSVAQRLNISEGNVSVVIKRLIEKGHLERLGQRAVRPRFTPPPMTPIRLKGTSRDALSLHIELTGNNRRVLDDVTQAIERLTWFKAELEKQMARERRLNTHE